MDEKHAGVSPRVQPALRRAVAEFLAEGLARSNRVVIVSTAENRLGIEIELSSLGVELRRAEHRKLARWFDSEEILDRVLRNGMPDESAFDEVTKEIFLGATPYLGLRIHVYSDLVDLVRSLGKHAAAEQLDRLWNGVCEQHADVVLAYTVANLYREKDCSVRPASA